MRASLVALAVVILTGSATPQTAAPPVVEVRLSNYEFTSAAIHLQVGQDQVLRLVNGHGSHSFSAPELFSASRIVLLDAPDRRDLSDPLHPPDALGLRHEGRGDRRLTPDG